MTPYDRIGCILLGDKGNKFMSIWCQRITVGALLTTVLLATVPAAQAADITIVDGQTETTTQASTATGDTITIQTGGTIATVNNNENGVNIGNDDVTVNNAGTITTSGTGAAGIEASGASNPTITNDGLILTTGVGAEGILLTLNTDNGTAINNGTISTTGSSAEAMGTSGGNNKTLINNGTITTTFVAPALTVCGGPDVG